jgi:hypothetical protein
MTKPSVGALLPPRARRKSASARCMPSLKLGSRERVKAQDLTPGPRPRDGTGLGLYSGACDGGQDC